MDLISLAAAKNYTNRVAAGITTARVEGNSIILTLIDGSEAVCQLPAPKDGLNGKDGISVLDLSIDTDGSLLCHMSDGTTIDAGYVPMADVKLTDYYTKEEIDNSLDTFYLIPVEIAHSSNKQNIAQLQKALSYVKTKNVALVLNANSNSIPKFFYLGTNVANKDLTTYTGAIKWYGEPQVMHVTSSLSGTYLKQGCAYITANVENGIVTSVDQATQIRENESYNSFKLPVLATHNGGGDEVFNPSKDYHPATKKYVDDSVAAIPAPDMTNYYTKEEIDAAIAAAITTVLEGEY